MHRTSDFAREDLPDVSPNALAELNHAFRRELSNRPLPGDRAHAGRQSSARRQPVEKRGHGKNGTIDESP
jgi:hypothetical protein